MPPTTKRSRAGDLVDWFASDHPGWGVAPGEVLFVCLLVLTTIVVPYESWKEHQTVILAIYYLSYPYAALATGGAAFEVFRSLRQAQKTDEGSLTPHLWPLGTTQNRLQSPTHTPTSVTGLHELFLHNFGPGLAIDVRVNLDRRQIDVIPYIAEGSSAQIAGAIHGHALDGTHDLMVTYLASSGKEHRLEGTLMKDRDLSEIRFRSAVHEHVYALN